MLVIWNRAESAEAGFVEKIATEQAGAHFSLLQRYEAFDLVNYFGAPEDLATVAHQITEDLPVYVNGKPVHISRGTFAFEGHPRTLVRFGGPVVRHWLRLIRASKVKIHFWCPPYGMCIELPAPDTLQQLVNRLPALVGSTPYTQDHCTRDNFILADTVRNEAGVPTKWVDLVCFSQSDKDRIRADLVTEGNQVIAESPYKIRISHDGSLGPLREMKGVKLVDQARPSITASTELLDALGIPHSGESLASDLFGGEGQIVAVADTGLDQGVMAGSIHPDFRGRVQDITSWPINESWNSYVREPGHDDGGVDSNTGHGTHVAGLALGNGEASDGRYRGVAPGASLVFQAIEQFTAINPAHSGEVASGYYLSGRPLDLRDLFKEARELGARIHVNAWGDPSHGGYTDDCYEADDFLAKNPDAVILFAAGNDGADRDGNQRIDAGSLYSPASAKNVIAIGATEGPRQGVGLRVNWDAFDQARIKRFANSADRNDAISGEPEHIALISSAGPTRDGRIKPDLCAPGTNLAAPRSQATQGKGWGLASPFPYYMYYGGTSMSTGTAGGFFALLRQSWQAHLHDTAPTGVALKALAILAAQPVLQRNSDLPEPRFIAGFGRINLVHALPGKTNSIRLIDHREPGLHAGEMKQYPFTLNRAEKFRAVLVWNDVPGEVLINNLNLCLERDGEIVHWGNHAAGETGQPDQKNNVEMIDVTSLTPGNYVLRVIAANVPVAPQTFALVFNGPGENEISIPVEWISGIGPVYAKRLREAGVQSINQLLDLTMEDLQSALKIKGRGMQTLFTKLLLLDERLRWNLSAHISADISLAQLDTLAPPDVPAELWQSTTRYLLPLVEVFDRNKHHRIYLRDLYFIQS